MSTFSGKIQEIPDISVDRFDDHNLKSEAYFLSHCHFDHMVGLNRDIFQSILIKYNKFLYVSDVSSVILKAMYPCIRNNIKILDMYMPTLIQLKDKTISVIPLPAGHCPGSVMFLFEYDVTHRILYTGDYRISKNDIKKFKSFYNTLNEVKTIDKIYLDTTFFLKRYLRFPKREESLNELCNILKEWIDRGKNYMVKLFTSAKYGYEYVFNEIYKQTGMPVHINRDIYKIYSIIPEMDNSVTIDGSLTQIHCNCGATYQSICNMPNNSKLRTVKISAIRWQQDDLENGLSSSESDVYYVCYSTHASYEEGVALIKFLKPKSIEACVTYDDPYSNLEIMNLIKENLEELRTEIAVEDKPKLFDTETEVEQMIFSGLESSSSNGDFGILDSPPRKYDQTDFLNIREPDLENFEEITKGTGDNRKLSNSVEKVSHGELGAFSGIFNCSSQVSVQKVLYKADLKYMNKFKNEEKGADQLNSCNAEEIQSLSSASSSCSDDVIFLDSPLRVTTEKDQGISKENIEHNLVNDTIITEPPPNKKTKIDSHINSE